MEYQDDGTKGIGREYRSRLLDRPIISLIQGVNVQERLRDYPIYGFHL